MGAQFEITPTMSSSRMAALAFIRHTIGLTGKGPSVTEIARAIDRSRETAKRARNRLARDGDIILIGDPGKQRAIALPDTPTAISTDDAIARLRAAGYTIDEDVLALGSPIAAAGGPVTNEPLPILRALDHIPGIDFEPGVNSDSKGRSSS